MANRNRMDTSQDVTSSVSWLPVKRRGLQGCNGEICCKFSDDLDRSIARHLERGRHRSSFRNLTVCPPVIVCPVCGVSMSSCHCMPCQ